MTYRAKLNEVRYKVRRMVMLLREFTVREIVQATRLNESSVRTEINRMKKEGLVSAHDHPKDEEKRRGRSKIYRLTDDPRKIAILSESTASFSETPSARGRPESRSFTLAAHFLDRALGVLGKERELLLRKAELRLRKAEDIELETAASGLAQAHFDYLKARLHYLRSNYANAKNLFVKLKSFFAASDELEMVRNVDTYLADIEIEYQVSQSRSVYHQARCTLDVLVQVGYRPPDPIAARLLSFLRELATMGQLHEVPDPKRSFIHEDHRIHIDATERSFVQDLEWVQAVTESNKVDRARRLAQEHRLQMHAPDKDKRVLQFIEKLQSGPSYSFDVNDPDVVAVLRREECFYLYLEIEKVESGSLWAYDIIGALIMGHGADLLKDWGKKIQEIYHAEEIC